MPTDEEQMPTDEDWPRMPSLDELRAASAEAVLDPLLAEARKLEAAMRVTILAQVVLLTNMNLDDVMTWQEGLSIEELGSAALNLYETGTFAPTI